MMLIAMVTLALAEPPRQDAEPAQQAVWAMVQWRLPMPGPQRGSDMWYRLPVRTVSDDGPIVELETLTPHEYAHDGAVVSFGGNRSQYHCGTYAERPLPPFGSDGSAQEWGVPAPEDSPPNVLIRAICAQVRPRYVAPSMEAALEQSAALQREWKSRLAAEAQRR